MINDELAAAWAQATTQLSEGWEIGGIAYHGPDHPGPWVAFLLSDEGLVAGPEGSGATPFEALAALILAIRNEDSNNNAPQAPVNDAR